MLPEKYRNLLERASEYVLKNRQGDSFRFTMSIGGAVTLYSSLFAAMTLHYCGVLAEITAEEKAEWAEYINSFQDPLTGIYRAPEVFSGELSSAEHNEEHLSLHLMSHVLPSLSLLGSRPLYDLSFAKKFLKIEYLTGWLSKRDWKLAWLEGNNLLFVGQLLNYFRENGEPGAEKALEFLLGWLDDQIDPKTGLWGTNGYCDKFVALYGGYHQLILYYYLQRSINYPEKLIDTVLSTQHIDGGYSRWNGGGSCQDVDAVDILSNLYFLVNYRRSDIRKSFRRAEVAVMRRQTLEGGFQDRVGYDFIHMGMEMTRTSSGKANMFSTWFAVHTLALINDVLKFDLDIRSREILDSQIFFNDACSMGWHRKIDNHWQDRNPFSEKLLGYFSVLQQETMVFGYRLKKRLV